MGFSLPIRPGIVARDLSFYRLWISLRVSPWSAIPNWNRCVHAWIRFRTPSWNFAPYSTSAAKRFSMGLLMPQKTANTCMVWLPSWCPSHFATSKALFHAWSAHGILLSELFACFKAVTLSGSYCSPAVSQKTGKILIRNQSCLKALASKPCSLKTSSTFLKVIKPQESLVLSQVFHF